jgi:hypothetical protein
MSHLQPHRLYFLARFAERIWLENVKFSRLRNAIKTSCTTSCISGNRRYILYIAMLTLSRITVTGYTILLTKTPLLKGKGLPQHAESAQGVPGRLRPRIFLTFGTTRVVGRQPYAPAAFTPGEIPGFIFRGWVDTRAHGSVGSYGKNPQWHHWELIPRPSD